MKVLILSLGTELDLILNTAVISDLKKLNDECRISVGTFAENAGMLRCLPEIEEKFLLSRKSIENRKSNEKFNLKAGAEYIEKYVREIDDQDFDLVVSFTFNDFGVKILSSIEAKEKVGLQNLSNGSKIYRSRWLKLLHQSELLGQSSFHPLEIFKKIITEAETTSLAGIKFKETQFGVSKATKLSSLDQIATFEFGSAKDKSFWGRDNLSALVENLNILCPKLKFVLIGNQNLSKEMEKFCVPLWQKGIEITPFAVEREVQVSILRRSSLLVACDPILKTMAAAWEVPVVDLLLGSAISPSHTALSLNSIVIESKESCFPCEKNVDCYRHERVCAGDISVELVSFVSQALLFPGSIDIERIAKKFSQNANIYMGIFEPETGFFLRNLSSSKKGEMPFLVYQQIYWRSVTPQRLESLNSNNIDFSVRDLDLSKFQKNVLDFSKKIVISEFRLESLNFKELEQFERSTLELKEVLKCNESKNLIEEDRLFTSFRRGKRKFVQRHHRIDRGKTKLLSNLEKNLMKNSETLNDSVEQFKSRLNLAGQWLELEVSLSRALKNICREFYGRQF